MYSDCIHQLVLELALFDSQLAFSQIAHSFLLLVHALCDVAYFQQRVKQIKQWSMLANKKMKALIRH